MSLVDRKGFCRRRHYLLFVGWLSLMAAAPAFTQTLEMEVAPEVTGIAGFVQGDAQLPPVLILHGFLQTRHFPTVSRLGDGLAGSGYTILTPTLSLGITGRRRSQPCEALHLQDLHQDVAELAAWVQRLYRETRRRIVLVGHSSGGHVITRYLHDHPQAPVERVILISPGHLPGRVMAPEPPREDGIGHYALGFCQQYMTTPRAFRSYVDWGTDAMLNALQRSSAHASVILGSDDKRMPSWWVETLKESGIDVTTIHGANHFFDTTHEFDLLGAVESLME